MAATLIGHDSSNSANTGAATSIADLAWPVGISAGDLAYIVASDLNNTAMAPSDAAFTSDTQQLVGSAGARLFRKVCDGTETGNTGFSLSGTGSRLAGLLFVVHGAGAPTEALVNDNTGPAFSVPQVTPTEDNTLLIAAFAGRHNSVVSPGFSAPTGYTELEDTASTNTTGNIAAAWLGSKQLGISTAGNITASGLVITSNSTGGGGVTWLFSFPAAAVGAPVPVPSGWAELRLFTQD